MCVLDGFSNSTILYRMLLLCSGMGGWSRALLGGEEGGECR